MASATMSSLDSIKYSRGSFFVLDQLLVPSQLTYVPILSVSDGVTAIQTMQVRGAPLIAMVGCLSIAVELEEDLKKKTLTTAVDLLNYVRNQVDRLIAARPTAVNMQREGTALVQFVEDISHTEKNVETLKLMTIERIEDLLQIDVQTNKAIGKFGAADIFGRVNRRVCILTHCNTGSLATCGFGTALGVIRTLHHNGHLEHAYFTETRPFNQGSRLTSFELLHDNIPSTMICDSAVSWLMKTKQIDAVVVGADRVIWNGDTANKIGTYQLALVAKAHNVPFYVAAPNSTVDRTVTSDFSIKIEERSPDEVTSIAGVRISPVGISVWNPSFDVTPGEFITGIITEDGVVLPSQLVP